MEGRSENLMLYTKFQKSEKRSFFSDLPKHTMKCIFEENNFGKIWPKKHTIYFFLKIFIQNYTFFGRKLTDLPVYTVTLAPNIGLTWLIIIDRYKIHINPLTWWRTESNLSLLWLKCSHFLYILWLI